MYDFDMTFYYEVGQSLGDCTLLTLRQRWLPGLKGKYAHCAVFFFLFLKFLPFKSVSVGVGF